MMGNGARQNVIPSLLIEQGNLLQRFIPIPKFPWCNIAKAKTLVENKQKH